MNICSWLVLLTYNLALKAIAAPDDPNVTVAFPDGNRSLKLNNTRLAELTTPHSPDINFINTVVLGNRVAQRRITPEARPVMIVGSWLAQYQRDFPRCPSLRMYFTTPTRNFTLRTEAPTYGIWGSPVDWPAGVVTPTRPFELIFLYMDLPEAWRRVQAAGWNHPLNRFQVSRHPLYPDLNEIVYDFWIQRSEFSTQEVLIGVLSKVILFLGEEKEMNSNQSSVGAESIQGGRHRISQVATS